MGMYKFGKRQQPTNSGCYLKGQMLAEAQRKNSHTVSGMSCGVVVIMENSFIEQLEIKLLCVSGIQGLCVSKGAEISTLKTCMYLCAQCGITPTSQCMNQLECAQ